MITVKELKAAGYTCYASAPEKGAVAVWCKIIRNKEGERIRRYTIDFYQWSGALLDPPRFSVEVRLYQRGGVSAPDPDAFDLHLQLTEKHTIDDVEAFYSEAYFAMTCIPDPHND